MTTRPSASALTGRPLPANPTRTNTTGYQCTARRPGVRNTLPVHQVRGRCTRPRSCAAQSTPDALERGMLPHCERQSKAVRIKQSQQDTRLEQQLNTLW